MPPWWKRRMICMTKAFTLPPYLSEIEIRRKASIMDIADIYGIDAYELEEYIEMQEALNEIRNEEKQQPAAKFPIE